MVRLSRGSIIARVATIACVVLLCGAAVDQARAQTPPDPAVIEQAIVNGLAWLVTQQQADGGWGPPGSCDRISLTGLVVTKLETRARELRLDPLDPAYEYSAHVTMGLAFLMSLQLQWPIGPQPAGNPDGDGDGIGVYFQDPGCPAHDTYNTAIALMALSASGHPELYGGTAQDVIDQIAWSQADANCGAHRGGWRYMLTNDCDTDNSNSGWVTAALGYAQAAPPVGLGLSAPPFVKDELSLWLDVMQDDVNGDAEDGGSWYAPGWFWVNILKTGSLIYEFGLVGDAKESTRVQDAVDYLERHWLDMNNDPGWGYLLPWANKQAMFNTMKGLEAMGIDLLDLDGDGTPEWDWYAEFANVLIAEQQGGGFWVPGYWGDQVTATAWALLVLEKSVPPLEIEVPVDVRPGSCPNPFDVATKGVVPVAVLGTVDFDVTALDPATLMLNGVAPLRWSYEDVGTPFLPFIGKTGSMDCNVLGPDGYMDLGLKYDAQALAASLGVVVNRQVLVLRLTGALKAELGGTPIVGEDVVVILKNK